MKNDPNAYAFIFKKVNKKKALPYLAYAMDESVTQFLLAASVSNFPPILQFPGNGNFKRGPGKSREFPGFFFALKRPLII